MTPLLVLQGGRDYQVTTEDFDGWRQALQGKDTVVFRFYPDLNPLFFSGTGPILPEEYEREGHVDAEVIDDIATWILSALPF